MDHGRKKIAYLKNGDVVEEVMSIGDVIENDILQNGGPYHYIGSFLKFARDCDVLLISLDMHEKRFNKKNGLVAMVLNTKRFQNKLIQSYLHLKAFVRIMGHLMWFGPDFILCAASGGSPLAACYLASKILNVPFVHSRHMRVELFRPSALQKIKMRADAWLIRKSAWVLCNGPYLKDQLIRIGVAKAKIIEFQPLYKNLPLADNKKLDFCPNAYALNTCNLFYVGRIEEKKGPFELLNASRKILSESDSVHLTYIGDGNMLKKLQDAAKQMGLINKVSFLGQLPHKEVLQKMALCDVLVIPTRQVLGEGRCKSAIEGLLMGCCLLVPDYESFRYLVKNHVNGIMYQPDSVEDMASKIRFLVENPVLRQQLGNTAKMMGSEFTEPKNTFLQALNKVFIG